MELFYSWYDGLDMASLVFFYSAALGGILLLVQILMQLVGGVDTDVDVPDGDVSGTADSSFQFLSIQFITGFSLMFGLVGLYLSGLDIDNSLAGIGAFIAGMSTGLLMNAMMKLFQRLQEDGTLNIQNAVNLEGRVYTTIKPNRIGKIQITLQGRLVELDARSNNETFKSGSLVRVVAVHGTQVEVAGLHADTSDNPEDNHLQEN